jgi:hypothetical protein
MNVSKPRTRSQNIVVAHRHHQEENKDIPNLEVGGFVGCGGGTLRRAKATDERRANTMRFFMLLLLLLLIALFCLVFC